MKENDADREKDGDIYRDCGGNNEKEVSKGCERKRERHYDDDDDDDDDNDDDDDKKNVQKFVVFHLFYKHNFFTSYEHILLC